MATPKSVKRAGAKKSHRKPKRSWNVYINRSLKAINSSMSLSSRTVKVINSFINDQFERIASQVATLARANKRSTISARELQTAVRLVLPAELSRHAMAEGTKAVSNAAK